MIRLLLLFLLFVPLSCSNPKTVLICGDHVCVDKNEAKLYFEDNLTLEVKIINKKQKKSVDLVQLNLKENTEKKSINIIQKKNTSQPIKVLSNKEIQIIKKNIKDKKKAKRITSKKTKKKKKKLKVSSEITKAENSTKVQKKIINNNLKHSIDICTILEECSIDQISNYLIKMGKNKRFPDITVRE